jgi:dihydrofolate synthase/folylpolyglutamate synthase
MNYSIKEVQDFLDKIPSFQKHGKVAYKPGVESMAEIDALMGYPSKEFKSVHVAGTNGKGSTSHMIASALMQLKNPEGTDLKVGLYTSPHLLDFRERVKINGEKVPLDFVYDFIYRYKDTFENIGASYFEITTALAFEYFAKSKVDIAVIECGLGGRLDSTNIISPLISVITNIGKDHCEHLGYNLDEIAREKAGIIKGGVPVVVGEKGDDPKVSEVFDKVAADKKSRILYAENFTQQNSTLYSKFSSVQLDLKGDCQEKNLKGVFTALYSLLGKEKFLENFNRIVEGISCAAKITGLMGRWQQLQQYPLVVCDTGHNAHGFKIIHEQLDRTFKKCREIDATSKLYMIFGVVADKDLSSIINYLPKENTCYLYVNAKGDRALKAELLQQKMAENGFDGIVYSGGEIDKTLGHVLEISSDKDMIFIGGSTFVVAEALKFYKF